MKIATVRIENFRTIKDITIDFDRYNCLIGPNGAGKSTVLNALNIFFRETKSSTLDLINLSKEDYHCFDISKPIIITVIFTDLSDIAKEDLKAYVRNDKLIVKAIAEWSEVEQSAQVVQKGIRMGMAAFAPFFKAEGDGAKVDELKKIFAGIKKDFQDIPSATTKQAMLDALREYEGSNPDKCSPLDSNDEFYGVSKGSHLLGPHIQWIYIPAVKEATDEQIEAKDTALGRLVERTVRTKVKFSEIIKALKQKASDEYNKILADNNIVLNTLSESIKNRLTKWAHPDVKMKLQWDKDPEKAIRVEEPFARVLAGEGEFLGELGRLGHGFRRSFLLALLEELSGVDQTDAPSLVLGIEEPELFQHPPQAQHLADVLQSLSEQNAQVIACSHSPYYAVGKGFEDLRLLRKPKGSSESTLTSITFENISRYLFNTLGDPKYKRPEGLMAKMHSVLQPELREIFFASTIILTEGAEDRAYIHSAMHLSGKWEQWRSCGAHLVPVDGKSKMVIPLAIAKCMNIPCFVMFDADGHAAKNKKKDHESDNVKLLKILELERQPPFPTSPIMARNCVIWPNEIEMDVKAEYKDEEWNRWKSEMEVALGQSGNLNKNPLFVAGILEKAWANNKPSNLLIKVCDNILKFVENPQ